MNNTAKNSRLYSKLWKRKSKKIKSCKFWITWEKFKSLIPSKNPMLLDIGCGIRPRIPVKGSYFLDLSQSALETLAQKGGICHCGDAQNLPYKSKSFDLINASEILEHIKNDTKVLKEINRVLKPEAHFSLSVPLNMKYWTKFDAKVNHIRRYDPKNLYNKITEAGFRIKSYYLNNPSKSPVLKNFASWFLSKRPNLSVFLEENIGLPISERIQKLKNRKWCTENFVSRLQNASGVIAICQKI